MKAELKHVGCKGLIFTQMLYNSRDVVDGTEKFDKRFNCCKNKFVSVCLFNASDISANV